MSRQRISRRDFLAATATTAAITIVPRQVLGGSRNIPPSEKLNIAGIGVGGMGKSNLRQLESIVIRCYGPVLTWNRLGFTAVREDSPGGHQG